MMTDSTDNVENVLEEVIANRQNNTLPDTKAIKAYINKNFATDVEKELIESIVMELLDHNIIKNRPTFKTNSYFITKNNKTPIDVILVEAALQVTYAWQVNYALQVN